MRNLTRKLTVLFARKPTNYAYLDDEVRSPIKERNDFELEFIRDVFTQIRFTPQQYLANEFQRVSGIANSQKIADKLDKCRNKTSCSLKELVEQNYPDFIQCFHQIHDIQAFFTQRSITLDQLLRRFQQVLAYQEEIHFELDASKWQHSLQRKSESDKYIYDEQNIIVIPGNEMVDSPSQLVDDIGAMCDERKWFEAISILNVITQDMYRGEYNYLKRKTRKHLKHRIVAYRKFIYQELSKLLMMNAFNKAYRHRITVYILKIQKERYFNRGVKLYFKCKEKELNHYINQLHSNQLTTFDNTKAYITELTILMFTTIHELVVEFNAILVETSLAYNHKNAMSYLIVFIFKKILLRYVAAFKIHVYEASKCDISLQSIGDRKSVV